MDKQLDPPTLIRPLGTPTKLSTLDTYNHLSATIMSLPPSSSRTQLERLTDALGVECGVVDVSEEERREKERAKRREERRRVRRLQREAEEAEADSAAAAAVGYPEHIAGDKERQGLGGPVPEVLGKRKDRNGLDEPEVDDDELEDGVADGDVPMDDRGDVEYGDIVDEDEDEPDNEDGKGQESE